MRTESVLSDTDRNDLWKERAHIHLSELGERAGLDYFAAAHFGASRICHLSYIRKFSIEKSLYCVVLLSNGKNSFLALAPIVCRSVPLVSGTRNRQASNANCTSRYLSRIRYRIELERDIEIINTGTIIKRLNEQRIK